MRYVGESFSMKSIFTLILFLTFPLLAYTPGKWSYKDQFTLYQGHKGPSKEIIRNGEGVVTYVAEYTYNEEGRLVQEIYSDKEGKADGKTSFQYKDGVLVSEESFGSDERPTERKEFYFKNNILKKLVTRDGDGKILIQYNLTVDKDGSVIAGEGKNSESNDLESFKFLHDTKRPNVQIQYLLDDKKKTLGEIHFKYDTKGNLIEREFFQGEVHRVHKLKYKNDGSLESFSFHMKQGDTWVIEKTHTLLYEDPNKNKLSKKD
jgi:antitoxin component YwqK of YwqJK toxin-antitoxin module